jgi:hypothetical protein
MTTRRPCRLSVSQGCPVYSAKNASKAAGARHTWEMHSERGQTEGGETKASARGAARAEVAFLKSLLPTEST